MTNDLVATSAAEQLAGILAEHSKGQQTLLNQYQAAVAALDEQTAAAIQAIMERQPALDVG